MTKGVRVRGFGVVGGAGSGYTTDVEEYVGADPSEWK